MSATTKIEWCDRTWNPVTGCTRASRGCDNCYAVKMTKRLASMNQSKYQGLINEGKNHFNGVVQTHEDSLLMPLSWRKRQRVFVNSMSDLFHKDVPFEFIDKVFAIMALCPQHTFQILTKRPERMAEYVKDGRFERGIASVFDEIEELAEAKWVNAHAFLYDQAHAHKIIRSFEIGDSGDYGCEIAKWPLPNLWLGTSVEDQETADKRIPELLRIPAAVRFLSCEPLLGPVNLNQVRYQDLIDIDSLNGTCGVYDAQKNPLPIQQRIHWVIVGGESGPNARPMQTEWARSLRDQCVAAGVPYFFKQWGAWAPTWCDKSERIPIKGTEFAPGWNGASNFMFRVGKARAGRLLDGRTWDDFPGVEEWEGGDNELS